MYYKEETLLEQYTLEILDTYKGRGAIFAMTDRGRVYLKEYSGSEAKAEFLAKLLEEVHAAGIQAEQVIPTQEGEILAKDPEGNGYILRKWCEGKECNTANWDEILAAVRILAAFHNVSEKMTGKLPAGLGSNQEKLLKSYEKHTRELRTIKNYVRNRKNKSEFEKGFLELYPKFEEQALEVLEGLRAQQGNREGFGICHGDFSQHNVVFREKGAALICFDNLGYDVQVSDLARFMRKILEKNQWNMGLGMEMIRAYGEEKPLSEYETEQIYLRLAYPEKFWKLANHYYNANKAWGFGRYLEKLEKIKAMEGSREQFLEYMKHFTYA